MDPSKSKLRVYNTLTRSVEDFTPLKPGRVNMFVCGPTVWDTSHVGHAKTYVAYDIMARYLRHKGFSVFFILNITDIDDKIISKAKQAGEDPLQLAKRYATAFFKDMKDIGVSNVNLYANASDHVPEIIEQIEGLVKKGIAYPIDGDVYFDTSKFPGYGKLSKQNLDQLKVHRIDPDPRKKNTADFVLWKSQKPDEVFWESPWGRGRPGWHIEDTAITLTYFGPSYDIHGGGNELIFPHHEAEIAQAEGLTGKEPLARYWLHTGLLNISGREMHKSLGNIIPIQDVLRKIGPDALRVLYASTHYRSPLEFTEGALEQAGSLARRFRRAYRQLELAAKNASKRDESSTVSRLKEAQDEFYKAMDDDFNTPAALTAYVKIVALAEEQLKMPAPQVAKAILEGLQELGSILGVLEAQGASQERLSELANLLMELRTELRAKKQYDLADSIRQRMVSMGLIVEDEAKETYWTA
ncbi:cysteine--tRNA ligase [Candidatus Bathyarchaeota archaeon]|nr:MAG: cysteine--tRNA ligase [Candidatus Bathyarchaeota archaeon]